MIRALAAAGLLLAAAGCAPGVEGAAAPGGPRPLDPPAAPGAMAPSLALDGADVLLTWLEPATGTIHLGLMISAGSEDQIAEVRAAVTQLARVEECLCLGVLE